MKQKKIAFIYYPHDPELRRLETMPFSLNTVVSLGKMGCNVDLYLWEEPSSNYKDLFAETVTIKYFRDRKLGMNRRNVLKFISFLFKFRFRWQENYCCVFGVGQIGAHIANMISQSSDCPFIYFNDEFPKSWGNNYWTQFEQQAVKQASMLVLPDLQRFHPLCQELDVSKKAYAFLPNIPIVKPPFEEINWHQKLGIPNDFIPFLHAGSIADWSQIPEILSSVPYWHEKAVLILHNAYFDNIEKYRQELSHLEVPGKVIWSYEPMSESKLNSLVSYCAGNFALYRTLPALEYMGFASGKLMRSIACGSPVIASQQPSLLLSFVEDYQLGVLVNHPVEIPAAVEEIIHNKKAYSSRCLDFSHTNISFEKSWHKFCEQLKQTVNIDLTQPIS